MPGWLLALDRQLDRHFPVLLEWLRPARQRHLVERAPCSSDGPCDVQACSHEWMRRATTPSTLEGHDFRVQVGSAASCSQPYRACVFNIAAASVDALSADTILALGGAARRGGFAHDTGEGPISAQHRVHGGDLIWQIGPRYAGCGDEQGRFDPLRFAEQASEPQVRMIEISLGHAAFGNPIELMLFIERLRRLSGGKPVGIKRCAGHPREWFALVKAMLHTHLTPDFIVVDGADALRRVHDTLVGTGLRERIRIGCVTPVASAFDIARAMALGADWCSSAHGFMFALGCPQASDRRHPRARAVPDRIERIERFHRYTLEALKELVQAAGLTHPREIRAEHIQHRSSRQGLGSLAELRLDVAPGAVLAAERGECAWPDAVFARDWPCARADSFSPAPLDADSLGAEHAVAGVAQAGHDVAVLVELPVDGRGVDRHVGMVGVKVRQALGC
jgi:glutamate synthase domain-containing protein 2